MPLLNIDPSEINKFAKIADAWWNPRGPMKGLHDLNPLRTAYIRNRMEVKGKTILDIGCGGGILSESLAAAGGEVTGIDLNAAALEIARLHAQKTGLAIDYRNDAAETLADEETQKYDAVACMEVLEHVPDPRSIVNACKKLVKPDGHVFLATLNRTWISWLLAIVAAEYLLKIVRKGTHSYNRFITPGELTDWAKAAGLSRKDLSGIRYIPFGPICYLTRDSSVNYMMHFQPDDAA